jgi:hypothetical protein
MRRLPLVEKELLTLLENLSLSPVFAGVRATQSLVFQLSNMRITKRFWLAGDDDYLKGATSINHQVALRANFKIYSRSTKGGQKGDLNRNPWLVKMQISWRAWRNLFVINLIWKHLLSTSEQFQSFGRRERCFHWNQNGKWHLCLHFVDNMCSV